MGSIRGIKDRFMSVPWVYDTLRPLVIGGLEYDRVARFCEVAAADRVMDLGCGTGQLIPHIRCRRYLGIDVDEPALARARRFSAPHVEFLAGDAWVDACRGLQPTVVLMIGLVHHVSDDSFRAILERIRGACPSFPRIVTFESTYFRGYPVSNLLSRLDRGRFVRRPEEYAALFADCGLRIARIEVLPTRLGIARYIGYHLKQE